MKTVKVSVTQRHIDEGKRNNCAKCPIALAVRESGYPDAMVNTSIWILGRKMRWFFLPPEVVAFIEAFDKRLPVSPAVFELPLE